MRILPALLMLPLAACQPAAAPSVPASSVSMTSIPRARRIPSTFSLLFSDASWATSATTTLSFAAAIFT